MFEHMTFDYLMNRMLDSVDDRLDKREGSIMYTAIAPVALEMAEMYHEADVLLKQSFVGTAAAEYLDLLVGEFGYVRNAASKAVVKGKFNTGVEIGSRFNGGKWNYSVTRLVNDKSHEYELECESPGSFAGNYIGDITPIEYIDGLKRAEITGLLIPGEDIESDDDLRKRFFESIRNQRTDGNVAQYLEWISEFPGVGKGKVVPLWNGANAVKVIILNSENKPAGEELVNRFQDYLDPKQAGLGNGKAPIGAKVTVTTASVKQISIDVNVVLADGYGRAEGAREAIEELFSEIALSRSKVGYMEVGARLQGLLSCKWVRDLRVNGAALDIELGSDEIPGISNLNIKVVS